MQNKSLLSGNEAVAEGALAAGVSLGAGYTGTPSTEILEHFAEIGGKAQWSPNEKIALEVGVGAAYGKARALVTMKHVGLNVAADPFFTVAYTGVDGGLLIVSADDPGMSSSQNEQDNRHLAEAAEIPMLEASDSQECYDFTIRAFELSEKWKIPVLMSLPFKDRRLQIHQGFNGVFRFLICQGFARKSDDSLQCASCPCATARENCETRRIQ